MKDAQNNILAGVWRDNKYMRSMAVGVDLTASPGQLWCLIMISLNSDYNQRIIIFNIKMSANSPTKNSFTANRRTREPNSNQYPNLSQKSPDINSPNLN